MAPRKAEKARKRKRKARTEVSSPSESSSESEKSSPSPPLNGQQQSNDEGAQSPATRNSGRSESPAPVQSQREQRTDPEKAFEDFYLKQATKEFANDIDKLRSAPDFNERNVPVLIRALRQGTACFSEEERRRIGAAAG